MRSIAPLVLLGLSLAALPATPADAPEPLVGAWRLVRYVDTPAGGAPVEEFGANPIGLFVFTADGHVSISIMRNPPGSATPASVNPDACVPEWYCSYFGTYRVDHATGEWVTQVEAGNVPSMQGTEQRRPFAIEGNRLTVDMYYEVDGKRVNALRILEREAAAPR